MENVLIVIHLLVVIALVCVVLLQRSEGGALGIGGGGGGFMSARGAADTLTRTTSILATAFFLTSLALGLISRYGENPTDILNRVPVQSQQNQKGQPTGGNGILDELGGAQDSGANSTAPSGDAQTTAPGTDTQPAPATGNTTQVPNN